MQKTLGKPDWLECVQREMMACKTGVGVVDLSSQSIFEVSVSIYQDNLIQLKVSIVHYVYYYQV